MYDKSASRSMTSHPEWDEFDDVYEDDDPRCDFEKDPSLADGWFYNTNH